MWSNGNLHDRVNEIRNQLVKVQHTVENNPFDSEARGEEIRLLKAFNEEVLDEKRSLKQRSKINWLKEGDTNSSYFHKVVKGRQHRSCIHRVSNAENVIFEGDKVPSAFVDLYKQFQFPGTKSDVSRIRNPYNLFSKKFPVNMVLDMVRMVSKEEVKNTIFDIGEDKLAGPDGFTSAFFKSAWDISGR